MEIPVLETERLRIRPLRLDDLESIYRILDVQLAEADLATDGSLPKAARREWLKWSILSYEQLAFLRQPPYGDRAVELKTADSAALAGQSFVRQGPVIGAVGLVPALGPFGQLPSWGGQPCRNTPEIGLFYAISPRYQRQGFASEAAQALIDYAFNVLQLTRIVATTTFDNAASKGVMRRLGMRLEQNPYPEPPWFQVVGILEHPG
jgi:RimJ/RimL family protein N-acetyltransferase